MTSADILSELRSLVVGDPDGTACLANAAALLYLHIANINWVGFYLDRGSDLVVGPFQGKPACTRIPYGKGVCGTSFAQENTLLVDDVELFPGHIACDSASRSEIVVPLRVEGRVVGVLDCDSPIPARFSPADRALFEGAAEIIGDWLGRSKARF